jgi:hypothetical protein
MISLRLNPGEEVRHRFHQRMMDLIAEEGDRSGDGRSSEKIGRDSVDAVRLRKFVCVSDKNEGERRSLTKSRLFLRSVADREDLPIAHPRCPPRAWQTNATPHTDISNHPCHSPH